MELGDYYISQEGIWDTARYLVLKEHSVPKDKTYFRYLDVVVFPLGRSHGRIQR